jgi:hypothetical protein
MPPGSRYETAALPWSGGWRESKAHYQLGKSVALQRGYLWIG